MLEQNHALLKDMSEEDFKKAWADLGELASSLGRLEKAFIDEFLRRMKERIWTVGG